MSRLPGLIHNRRSGALFGGLLFGGWLWGSGKFGPFPVRGLSVDKQVNKFAAWVFPFGNECLLAKVSVSYLEDFRSPVWENANGDGRFGNHIFLIC